jgi:DNA-binding NarL/FixJ family response regulator
LLASGLSTKQIAKELGVSAKTVETHRQHVME